LTVNSGDSYQVRDVTDGKLFNLFAVKILLELEGIDFED